MRCARTQNGFFGLRRAADPLGSSGFPRKPETAQVSPNTIIVLSYAASATMRPRGRPERSSALHVRNKQTGEGPTCTDVAHLTQKQVEHYLVVFGISRRRA